MDIIPAAFWGIVTPNLQNALVGCHKQHGIVSTRKAIAALRYNKYIAAMLNEIETEKIASDQNSTPFIIIEGPIVVKASPCVVNTSRSLLKTFAPNCHLVDEEIFLENLLRISCGPTVDTWRKDGYNADRIIKIIRDSKNLEGRTESEQERGTEYEREGEYETHSEKIIESRVNNNNNNNNNSKSESDSECKICFDKEINTAIVPCGHVAICFGCSAGLQQCPICRGSITQVMQTYRA